MSLKDALRGALAGDEALEARETQPDEAEPASGPILPEPAGSAWLELLSEHASWPADASVGRLRQLSDQTAKRLKKEGHRKAAQALSRAQADWFRKADKAMWSQVKRRFGELGLPDKAYRSLKQSQASAEKILVRLHTRRAEEYRGAGTERVREWLSG